MSLPKWAWEQAEAVLKVATDERRNTVTISTELLETLLNECAE